MTIVVELRDLKKALHRPIAHFWQGAAEGLCVLRVRLAFLCLLGFALECPFDPEVAARGGSGLALLCGVLSAAVSATFGLLCDASVGLYALFSDDASPLFWLTRRLGLCLGDPMFAFDICPGAGPFPTFSGRDTLMLVACALFLFGCGFSRQGTADQGGMR